MEDYDSNVEEIQEKQVIEQDGLSSTEEGFMRGYMDEEEIEECSECGSALNGEGISKKIDDEKHIFCSESCVSDFQEGM